MHADIKWACNKASGHHRYTNMRVNLIFFFYFNLFMRGSARKNNANIYTNAVESGNLFSTHADVLNTILQ